MATVTLRRSFIAFHLTLGIVLLFFSIRTAVEALAPGLSHANPHIVVLAITEAVGAGLFLWSRTLRAGAVLLLLTIGMAFLVHVGAGQFRGDLLVYATGTWFVMIHGSGRARPAKLMDVAA